MAQVDGGASEPVTWSVLTPGGGSVDAGGLYTAPVTPGQYAIAATSVATSETIGFATATVVPQAAVLVSPASVFVAPGATTSFVGTVTGVVDPRVAWTVVEGSTGGAIDSAGRYTAPSSGGPFHVTARSTVDPEAAGTSTVTLRTLTISSAATVVQAAATLEMVAQTNDPGLTAVTWYVDGLSATYLPIGEAFRFGSATAGTHLIAAVGAGSRAETSVTVTERPTFALSGSAVGLTASALLSVYCRLNSHYEEVLVTGDGSFTFPTPVPAGCEYTVGASGTSLTSCALINYKGVMPSAHLNTLRLDCSPQIPGPLPPDGYHNAVDTAGRYLVPLFANAGPLAANGGSDNSHFRVGRFLADGSLDATFGSYTDPLFGPFLAKIDWFLQPTVTYPRVAMAYMARIQADGRIVVAGGAEQSETGGLSVSVVARLLEDGSLDPTFGEGGRVALPLPPPVHSGGAIAVGLELLPHGRILVAQHRGGIDFSTIGGLDSLSASAQLLVLSPSGDVEQRVAMPPGCPGSDEVVKISSLLPRSDGKIWVSSVPAFGTRCLTRLLPDLSQDTSFQPVAEYNGCAPGTFLPGPGGSFYEWDSYCGIVRRTEEGVLDLAAVPQGVLSITGATTPFKPWVFWTRSDGRVLAAGLFGFRQVYP